MGFFRPRYPSKECNICSWKGREFKRIPYPNKPADTLICPKCKSAERHRFAYFMLKDALKNYSKATLHFAPEQCISPWLKSISKEYLSVDLSPGIAMKQMNITNLQLENNKFSLLWCSHVLEHIEDDFKAISELFRVLRPAGLAVVMVPIYGAETYENPAIKSPQDRLIHFKQKDHVRLYGFDIRKRLANIGFEVNTLQISSVLSEPIEKHELSYPTTKEIFLCTKPETINDNV